METVRSSREIDRLFKEGVRSSHSLVLALIAPTPPGRGPCGRVAVIAGKKLGGAVTRNRAKRVLRSAVSRTSGPWRGWDVALIARERTGSANPHELDAAVRAVIKKAGVR